MLLKKSELYSSIWKSCDELRGGMDASQLQKSPQQLLKKLKYTHLKTISKEKLSCLKPFCVYAKVLFKHSLTWMLGKLTLKVLPIEEENNREAIIHFELYRLLKNNLAVFTSSTIQSVIVEPEKGVSSGSVDLLILVETPDAIIPFLSIEVKRPSGKSYWLFTEESKTGRKVLRELKSTYSALTDGEVLRLFRFNAEHRNNSPAGLQY